MTDGKVEERTKNEFQYSGLCNGYLIMLLLVMGTAQEISFLGEKMCTFVLLMLIFRCPSYL